MDFDTDVLVLGAGPVGTTLANELVRHGIKPRIVDRAPSIREVSKAMILHVRTQEVLDKVGVASRLVSEAQPLTEVVVHAYGKHIGSWDLDDIDSDYKHPLIIGQNKTQHALLDLLTAGGVDVQWNTEAMSFEMTPDGVTTTLKVTDPVTHSTREDIVRSRYICGCEGSNSLVRRSLNLTFEGDRYTGEQFIQADCRIRWALPKGRSYLFLTAVGYMMVIEFPNDVVRIFISLPDTPDAAGAKEAAGQLGAVESTTEEPTLEDIRHHLAELSGFACELSDPIWLARYRTSHRYANHFSQGRAFIAGDAGHVHVPIGGQGMNTGIQDAFNLGWKLAGVAKGELKPSVLESYHAERHPVAESLIKGTNLAYTGILHPSEARQHAARLFGPFLIRNERVQDFMRNTLEELKIFYPSSPLNLDLGGATGPRPGERVLDATMVRASDKSTVTINRLTRSPSWTLLIFGGRDDMALDDAFALSADVTGRFGKLMTPYVIVADKIAPESAGGSDHILLDTLHLAHERYGVTTPMFYLLRPDTYVGARGPLSERAGLLAHLETIFAEAGSN
ncbi:FAD-dependent monooxygenase [Bradyrhizobium sp. STM 3809]|uniref:FAD-dependent monooxygenase n=1 Tax=Bradyrhizobium sp. STM 3809 TaxID=551936 RepID=UPI0002408D9E|nr:FAD-dependent monooxygenase [Bradyrhizobium sp. STM 3809]CCE00526.1 putative monooxygenase, FAD binding (hydroxylase) [Bradyrhizobium sp. STM 3809]